MADQPQMTIGGAEQRTASVKRLPAEPLGDGHQTTGWFYDACGHHWPGGTYGVNCSNCGFSWSEFTVRLVNGEYLPCSRPTWAQRVIDGVIIEGPIS